MKPTDRIKLLNREQELLELMMNTIIKGIDTSDWGETVENIAEEYIKIKKELEKNVS